MPTRDARSHGRTRATGVSSVPRRIRVVAMAAAPSVTQASSPKSASQVKIPSHPQLSPSAASSTNSVLAGKGTTNP